MTEVEIQEVLKGKVSWDIASVSCKDSFITVAVKVRYSDDNVLNAWIWFYNGWVDALDAVQVAAARL